MSIRSQQREDMMAFGFWAVGLVIVGQLIGATFAALTWCLLVLYFGV